MSKVVEPEVRILKTYQQEVGAFADSIASALRNIAEGGGPQASRGKETLLHSTAAAFGALEKSVAAALGGASPEIASKFETRARAFRDEAARRVGKLLGRGAAR